jgi:hypothetical protein
MLSFKKPTAPRSHAIASHGTTKQQHPPLSWFCKPYFANKGKYFFALSKKGTGHRPARARGKLGLSLDINL